MPVIEYAASLLPLATATNLPLPYVTLVHAEVVGIVREVHVIPSTELAAVPPVLETATYIPIPLINPYATLVQEPLGSVVAVQDVPFVEYAAAVPDDGTATNCAPIAVPVDENEVIEFALVESTPVTVTVILFAGDAPPKFVPKIVTVSPTA